MSGFGALKFQALTARVLSGLLLRLAKISLSVGGRICSWGVTGHTCWGNLAAPVLAGVLEGLGRQSPHMLAVGLFVAVVAAENAARQTELESAFST